MAGAEASGAANAAVEDAGSAPERPRLVLAALIGVAAVANLGLAVANVALPEIGREFDASQVSLNLVAVGYSLGLAASVLYFGAVGDRYGRKLLLILGMCLTVPADCLAAWAPSIGVLFGARVLGGLAAGMAYPTTLALITALWSGAARTRSIALWAAIGGAISALGPLCSGILLEHFWWGSVFLLTLPLAVLALVMALKLVPAHVNETTEPVDHAGGVLSIVMVGALILGINFAPVPERGHARARAAARRRRGDRSLLHPPAPRREPALRPRRGGAADVLGRGGRRDRRVRLADGRDVHRPAVPAERARILDGRLGACDPAGGVLHGARGAALGETRREPRARASRCCSATCSCCSASSRCCCCGRRTSPTGRWASATPSSGIGVGLAGTPASHSLTSSVPIKRVGMASGTADLQRDLGGAIMQSIFGALLTAGYAAAAGAAIAASGNKAVTSQVESELTKSFSSAADLAKGYPASIQHTIIEGAKTSFLKGDQWAYVAGIIAVLLGAAARVPEVPPRRAGEEAARAIRRRRRAADHTAGRGGGRRGIGATGVGRARERLGVSRRGRARPQRMRAVTRPVCGTGRVTTTRPCRGRPLDVHWSGIAAARQSRARAAFAADTGGGSPVASDLPKGPTLESHAPRTLQPRKRQPGRACSTASISLSQSRRASTVSGSGGALSVTVQSRLSVPRGRRANSEHVRGAWRGCLRPALSRGGGWAPERSTAGARSRGRPWREWRDGGRAHDPIIRARAPFVYTAVA